MAEYSIWMVETAKSKFSGEQFYGGYHRNGELIEMSLGMMFIIGEGRIILIDTGVDTEDIVNQEFMKSRGYNEWRPASYAMEKMGIRPEEVTDIIITHGHWDHIGAVPLFPKAQFYIQKKEFFKSIEMLALPEKYFVLSRCTSHLHYEHLIALTKEHRLTLVDGPCDNFFPGIHIRLAADGHTFAGQMVIVDTVKNGQPYSYIVVGDATYAQENFMRTINGWYLPTSLKVADGGPYGMLKTMEYLEEFTNGDPDKVLIIHDSNNWQRYNSVTTVDSYHLAEVCLIPGERSRLKSLK
jgi:glyoxylase-like metal-dependent hydrolase (beta-lactamase superfamily II)